MMKLAIFGRLTENTDLEVLYAYFAYLNREKIPFSVYGPYAGQLVAKSPEVFGGIPPATFQHPDELADVKFIFSFGGDGTVLETARFIGRLGKPILGVNFGRLGFLTGVTQKELIRATDEISRDIYRVDERALLSVVSDPPGLFTANNVGINDFTIHKSNTNEMITVHTYINGEFLNSYWGDGLVVATPTGSTAYNLSCGGPIIFPNSGIFVITPVAPHSLTIRPVIIPDDWVISFEVQSRSGEAMTALDTRSQTIRAGMTVAVRKADYSVRLLRLSSTKYIDNLRKSLMWGSDHRN
jgi:NAD+ kinase